MDSLTRTKDNIQQMMGPIQIQQDLEFERLKTNKEFANTQLESQYQFYKNDTYQDIFDIKEYRQIYNIPANKRHVKHNPYESDKLFGELYRSDNSEHVMNHKTTYYRTKRAGLYASRYAGAFNETCIKEDIGLMVNPKEKELTGDTLAIMRGVAELHKAETLKKGVFREAIKGWKPEQQQTIQKLLDAGFEDTILKLAPELEVKQRDINQADSGVMTEAISFTNASKTQFLNYIDSLKDNPALVITQTIQDIIHTSDEYDATLFDPQNMVANFALIKQIKDKFNTIRNLMKQVTKYEPGMENSPMFVELRHLFGYADSFEGEGEQKTFKPAGVAEAGDNKYFIQMANIMAVSLDSDMKHILEKNKILYSTSSDEFVNVDRTTDAVNEIDFDKIYEKKKISEAETATSQYYSQHQENLKLKTQKREAYFKQELDNELKKYIDKEKLKVKDKLGISGMSQQLKKDHADKFEEFKSLLEPVHQDILMLSDLVDKMQVQLDGYEKIRENNTLKGRASLNRYVEASYEQAKDRFSLITQRAENYMSLLNNIYNNAELTAGAQFIRDEYKGRLSVLERAKYIDNSEEATAIRVMNSSLSGDRMSINSRNNLMADKLANVSKKKLDKAKFLKWIATPQGEFEVQKALVSGIDIYEGNKIEDLLKQVLPKFEADLKKEKPDEAGADDAANLEEVSKQVEDLHKVVNSEFGKIIGDKDGNDPFFKDFLQGNLAVAEYSSIVTNGVNILNRAKAVKKLQYMRNSKGEPYIRLIKNAKKAEGKYDQFMEEQFQFGKKLESIRTLITMARFKEIRSKVEAGLNPDEYLTEDELKYFETLSLPVVWKKLYILSVKQQQKLQNVQNDLRTHEREKQRAEEMRKLKEKLEAEQAKKEEEKRQADEKKAEEKRIAREKKAEEKRKADEAKKKADEEKKKADEEKKKADEEKKKADAEKKAKDAKDAEDKKTEEAKKKADKKVKDKQKKEAKKKDDMKKLIDLEDLGSILGPDDDE
ncbi:MAG: hypothetical protein K6F99_03140 [Lachnospiraceae bacterium]|nr:hypothetical protein [Lachnospiraceae bacterium]